MYKRPRNPDVRLFDFIISTINFNEKRNKLPLLLSLIGHSAKLALHHMCGAWNLTVYMLWIFITKWVSGFTPINLCSFQNEFINTNFCLYVRNKAELSAPLTDPTSSVYKAGLRLVSMEYQIPPCPYHDKWTSQRASGMCVGYTFEYVLKVELFNWLVKPNRLVRNRSDSTYCLRAFVRNAFVLGILF